MDGRYVVSGKNMLRMFAGERAEEIKRAKIDGAGALCAGGGALYCAGGENVVWRLDPDTLMPRALFASGPDVCDLRLSEDGKRLYVLCGGADSVLLLDARTGAPQLLARAGANPPRMALYDQGEMLAVAGGNQPRVALLHAKTLELLGDIPMPGPVRDVAIGRCLLALCLGEQRNSLLVAMDGNGNRRIRAIKGLPGALLSGGCGGYAATHGRISRFAWTQHGEGGGVLHAPGCAERMISLGERLIYTDMYTHTAFSLDQKGGAPQKICSGALEIAAL